MTDIPRGYSNLKICIHIFLFWWESGKSKILNLLSDNGYIDNIQALKIHYYQFLWIVLWVS